MKQIEPERRTDSINPQAALDQTRLPAQATSAVHPDTVGRHFKQLSTIIWIITAWLVGTLVSELNVIGAESRPARTQRSDSEASLSEPSVQQKSMLHQWTLQETEYAITHSGITEFDRVIRNHQLRPLFDSLIDQETRKQNIATVSPASDQAASDQAASDQAASDQAVSDQAASDQATNSNPATETAAKAGGDPASSPAALGTPTVGGKTIVAKTEPVATPTSIARTDEPAVVTINDPKDQPQDQPTAANELNSNTALDPSVEAAFEESFAQQNGGMPDDTKTQFAWKGFPTDSLPGIVHLVVHSFNELMSPVHVRPLATNDNVVSVADEASQSDGSIAYVELNTQETKPSSESPEMVVAEQPLVETEPSQLSAKSPSLTAPQKPTQRAEIVRFQPLLLQVPEASVMLPAPHAELVANSEPAPNHATPQDAQLTEPRLAAKWPFERAVANNSAMVTLNVDNADVRTVFEMLARGYQMNILVAPEVEGAVTANVDGLTPEQTLEGIVKMCNLNMQQDENLIYIFPSTQLPADARSLRVFPLDFARATTLEPAVQGLLSPVGNAYTNSIAVKDTMSTQESIVVVDIPSVIAEVESYILQADQAPRQVVIEAHILEVELTDDMYHGVDFEALIGGDLRVGALGLADNIATKAKPLFFAEIDGSDVNALITMLETTTDSKTLASPRVQVINGQNARIQVGQQLGFTVATVTQTSTIQDIQFLETGVVLSVTPTISRDGRILMQVKPEVSDGEINPVTLLPEEETREVETSVLLDNHQGVIIGGLIQEKDRIVIKKLPWLGDFRYVGKLFQRREAVRSRSEIIVALIPHIVERCVQDERSAIDLERTESPLLLGPLQRNCRPWEPRLPDSAGQEHCFSLDRAHPLLP